MRIVRDIITSLLKLLYLKLAKYPTIVVFIENVVFTLTPQIWKGTPRFDSWIRSKQYIKDHVNKKNKEVEHLLHSCKTEVIVMIDYAAPQYDRDAGSRTLVQWLKILVNGGMDVKFLPQNCLFDPVYGGYLNQIRAPVVHGKGCQNVKKWIQKNGHSVDYFFLSRPHISIGYIRTIRKYSNAKIIYYGHDVHFLRLQDKIKKSQHNKIMKYEAKVIERIEKEIWNEADIVYYPSNKETEYVNLYLKSVMLNNKAETVPVYAFDDFFDSASKNLRSRSDIMFVGGFSHTPNEDGVAWMIRYVMPIVWKILPDVCVHLIGSNPTEKIKEMCGDRVISSGYINDERLEWFYKNSRISVAPLTYGGGVKGKVVESMRYGLPIVTTSVGLQGLSHVQDGLYIADSPEEFAKCIIELVTNDEKWKVISDCQLNLAKRYFSTQTTKDLFAKHISSLRYKSINMSLNLK